MHTGEQVAHRIKLLDRSAAFIECPKKSARLLVVVARVSHKRSNGGELSSILFRLRPN